MINYPQHPQQTHAEPLYCQIPLEEYESIKKENKALKEANKNLVESVSELEAMKQKEVELDLRERRLKERTMKEELKVLHENCLYRMNALLDMIDKEEAHIRADNILCEVLEKIGFHDVVNVFHEIDKWYA